MHAISYRRKIHFICPDELCFILLAAHNFVSSWSASAHVWCQCEIDAGVPYWQAHLPSPFFAAVSHVMARARARDTAHKIQSRFGRIIVSPIRRCIKLIHSLMRWIFVASGEECTGQPTLATIRIQSHIIIQR